MKYTCVLPSIYQTWTDLCLKNSKLENVLVVDNTEDNKGVSGSWNLGIDKMKEDGSDWLVIISAAMRFGEAGGLDFIEALEKVEDTIALEAGMGIGWHMIAFSKETIEKVGRFDANFYPAYFEDIDYGHRIRLAFGNLDPPYWGKFTIDASIAGWGHGISLGQVPARGDETKAYMLEKWGDLAGLSLYDHPFNDPSNSLQYWPEFRGQTWEG